MTADYRQKKEKALANIREASGSGTYAAFLELLEAEHTDALFSMEHATDRITLRQEQGKAQALRSIIETIKRG